MIYHAPWNCSNPLAHPPLDTVTRGSALKPSEQSNLQNELVPFDLFFELGFFEWKPYYTILNTIIYYTTYKTIPYYTTVYYRSLTWLLTTLENNWASRGQISVQHWNHGVELVSALQEYSSAPANVRWAVYMPYRIVCFLCWTAFCFHWHGEFHTDGMEQFRQAARKIASSVYLLCRKHKVSPGHVVREV